MTIFDYQDLITLFNQNFKTSYNTVLVKGENEPIYLPSDERHSYHRLVFAHGFYASALHEIAHWCVAGQERRKLVDFGYWYNPDGRTLEEQRVFETIEVKPQALEWIFSQAAGHLFRVSADNISAGIGASDTFKQRIVEQARDYIEKGLPNRAAQFLETLLTFYKRKQIFTIDIFKCEELKE
jgi:elongation factor P hydroxylase